jgi:cell division septal protein FtsQ
VSDEGAPRTTDSRDGADARAAKKSHLSRLKVALIGIAGLLVLASPLLVPLLVRRMPFFHVHRIEIVGTYYVTPNDILSRLHVDTLSSVWDPTGPLEARVQRHPAVRKAAVHRKLPGTLVVEITERVPVALVPASGGFGVYDARGVALPIDPASVTVDAPVIMQRDTALLRLLGAMRTEMPGLYARVSMLRRAGRDELILQLKTEPVRAMQDVTLERLADLEPVEADLARKQLRVSEIDLRYRDQVIARVQ